MIGENSVNGIAMKKLQIFHIINKIKENFPNIK